MKLSIYIKLMMGFAAIIAILALSNAYVLFELNAVANGAKNILSSNVRTQELARQLHPAVQNEIEYAEKYLISNDDAYFSLFVETSQEVGKNIKLLFETLPSSEDLLLIENLQKAHASIVASMQQENSEPSAHNENQKQIRLKNTRLMLDSLDLLIRDSHFSIGKEITRIESTITRSVKIAFLLIAGTLFTAVTIALIIARTITRPIGQLIRGTEQIAQGNFKKILVSSHDEITLLASAINNMSSKINETNQLKAQMMQQISHELKTPLQAIQSAHDVLLISGSVKESRLRMLAAIKRGINKIADFSMQYLDLAKIETGAMQYNITVSDIHKIVATVVDEAKLVAASKNIHMELEVVAVPKVLVDREKVSIIISNLISNAIKYTRENGNINVSIGLSDGRVQVAIKDSGIGINPEELANVFDRFYQASNKEKIKSNGSGVGLAIVKAYTEGQGGKVLVESIPDQGSTFKVEFPIEEDLSLQA
ncbi:sensory box signal transduction histidine kinase [Desulforapulum autotrophicum HRM2]|uniref:histidine kinase n=1 Tax=Desulforapulum autotrophicum (strain ATCC 43914 / DSM 3382 / VKM B-1955 / HRM2) TaxID=177437 RepID=C0QK25_DESAH|nr:HAMP domain-containing sensor histidine kinase [Desulforapulum autotrophicum]ACN16051.1 sensory box signal transduction histidine kinase [Desulforapulum autotrophicum HRM2]